MEQTEYHNIFLHESSHFFYVNVHETILQEIQGLCLPRRAKILDAGCGAGLLAVKLKNYGRVIGIDMSPQAVAFSKSRGINARPADIAKLPFDNDTFDLITCIDVITNSAVKSDEMALSEMFRVLKPNGYLILRVSAFKWLKVSHDIFVHTSRRYTKNEISKIIRRSGGRIIRSTYMQIALLPFAAFTKLKEKILGETRPKSIIKKPSSFVNNLAIAVLRLEELWLRLFDLPAGLGILIVSGK